ncbi:MAG: SRPBCC family protein [Spirochaetes bacterium]|nr:SRPBCC family protein [Spirochaetota bacterium]
MKKVLLTAGIIIGVLILALAVTPAFLPASYTLKRSITIEAPAKTIYRALGDFNEFNKWQPWIRYEPTAKQEFTGKPFTVGARYAWTGKVIGSGSMTITALKENEFVTTALEFGMKKNSAARNTISLAGEGGKTVVTWAMTGDQEYFGRYFGLMMDTMMGRDFESGLKNLKAYSEKK